MRLRTSRPATCILPWLGFEETAAGLALAANEAPFIAEILRGGVLGVERGQLVAGQALGMKPAVLMRRIIAPQAIRTMVPALGNESISALKNSSLASVIAVEELTLRSTQLASSTFDFFSVSVIQLTVEVLLDLDRPLVGVTPLTGQPEKSALMPPREQPGESLSRGWHFNAAQASGNGPLAVSDTRAAERAKRAAVLARNNLAVEVSALRKSYGQQTVLNGIDLSLRIGEVVAILGPSGSGKSTFLRCINHLESWDSGTVRVAGRRLGFRESGKRMSPSALARERADIGVGMVFQQFNLFAHLSAKENVAGPLRWVHAWSRADADRRARDLLDRVGLTQRADALPRHLCGGQQQRVAIARALAPNPSALLLDEPTSALDPELINEVLDVIQRLAVEDGLTMIISTHQLRFADEVADRIVFLNDGLIVEEGPARRGQWLPSVTPSKRTASCSLPAKCRTRPGLPACCPTESSVKPMP